MSKRYLAVLLALSLVGGVFSALPATAQEAPAVPAEPNIVDPAGDANYINDANTAGASGNNHVTGQDASGLADILAVWLTNDADNISIHVQTEAPQPSSGAAYIVFFRANADDCLLAEFAIAAPSYQSDSYAEVEDTCAELDPAEGEVVSVEGPDGTGIITATFPRSYSAAFSDGAVIATPRVEMRNLNGGPASLRGPTIDNTDQGTDYTISSGGGTTVEPAPEEPPGKNDPPGKGKKKGCKKGKGKKKGACPGKKSKKPKKPKAPVADKCETYVPGDEGKDAPVTLVTAAATEDAPLEVAIEAPAGVPEVSVGSAFHNIQVDADGAEAGLYVRYEFPVYEDHDIFLNYASGSEAAHAAGFNPAPVPVALGCCDGTGSGGHSEQGAEALDGIRSADCAGYTLKMNSYASEGGEMMLKLWLGEPQNDPAAPGKQAFGLFYDLMGL